MTETQKIPLIIDTDMGPDDWTAILYLAKRDDIKLKAVTICGTGETHAHQGAQNCLRLLKMVNIDYIPVAFGVSKPLGGNHAFPKLMRFAIDRMLFLRRPKTKRTPVNMSAVELLYKTIKESSKNISILAIGPLTNIAMLIKEYPEILGKIKKIYIMGGAIDVPGNISSVNKRINNPYAEWNIYCDPKAANIVFHSGLSIILVPLDATNSLSVDREYLSILEKNKDNEVAVFCYKLLKRFGKRLEEGLVSLWDAVAASVIGREEIAQIHQKKIYVIQKEEAQSGRTIEDSEKGASVNICFQINKKAYENHFFNTILK